MEEKGAIKYLYNISVNSSEFELWSRQPKDETLKPSTAYSHMHFYAEFQYVYSGKETVTSDKKSVEVSSGCLCLIPSGAYHTISTAETVKRECFFIKFGGECCLSKKLAEINDVTVIKDAYIINAMDGIRENSDTELCGMLLASAVIKMLSLCTGKKRIAAPSSGASKETATERKLIVEEFMSRGHDVGSLSELANKLCLSKRQTRTVVKNVLGTDFNTAAARQRISNAVHIIKTTDIPLSEIASIVGYGSYSGFYMAFVRMTGKKPQDLRK